MKRTEEELRKVVRETEAALEEAMESERRRAEEEGKGEEASVKKLREEVLLRDGRIFVQAIVIEYICNASTMTAVTVEGCGLILDLFSFF